MNTIRKFYNGTVAVYRGVTYRSSTPSQGQVSLWDKETGEPHGRVPVAEVEELGFVRTVGTYLGEPFVVNEEYDNGQYWITYDGGNGRKIAEEWQTRQASEPESTFWREDRYTFMATVPKTEVHDVHEVTRKLGGA
jgi:hypothetical protein